MVKKPLFSIIIPTYNRAEKLRRALQSIDKQTLRDFEVIIGDDGSTDNTKNTVDEYSKILPIQYVYEANWGGPARPRNNAIKVAQGEWICLLDSDDWWYPIKLEVVSKHLYNSDILYHDLDIYSNNKKMRLKKARGCHLGNPVFNDLMRSGNVINNSSVVVRKSIVDMAGGFFEDKSLIAVEDFDLWLRIARISDRFTYIPKCLGAYWEGEGNITEVSDLQIERIKTLYNKHSGLLSDIDRKEAEAIMCYTIGSIKQKMGLCSEARKFFKIAFKSAKIEIKLKSFYRLI